MTLLKSGCVGFMTIDRWMAFWYLIDARVLLDGEDITGICRWFDDSAGEAEVLEIGPDGEIVATFDDVVVQHRHGRIQVAIP